MTNLLKKTSPFTLYGGSVAISAFTGLMGVILLSLAFSFSIPTTANAAGVRCNDTCYADATECMTAICESTSCAECASCTAASDEECAGSGTAAAPAPAPAATGPRRNTLDNPLGTSDIKVLVSRAIKIFTGLSGSFALLMFVYGGFLWVTSAGNMDKVKKGKQIFVWASIGLIVVFGSYAFLKTFIDALGRR